jgi:o-succinylbenzoate synthase
VVNWRLGWAAYRIPFSQPVVTAHGRLDHRAGAILWLDTPDGRRGLGEVAPLPHLAERELAQALRVLAALGDELERGELGLQRLLESWPDASEAGRALRAALESALLHVQARRAGLPLARWLSAQARLAVPVNAVVTAPVTGAAVEQARAAVAAGFQTVKVKVGTAAEDAAEVERVAAVRAAIGPGVRLRLDANGAWPLERAVRLLRRMARYEIELVEQPVPAGDLEGLAAVRRRASVPVAADEAVTGPEAARRLLELDAVDALVLKVPVAGGIAPAREIAERASERGCAVVVTSTLEAGVGLAAALHLAATLPGSLPACGLATGGLLATTLVCEPLQPQGGSMRLLSGAGLGVELDPVVLERWRAGEKGGDEGTSGRGG